MSKTCPPVRVNMKPVVDAAAAKVMDELNAEGMPAVHAVGRVNGLGKMIGFIPDRFDGTDFVMGYVTIPSVVNLATKMAQVGIIFPQVDLALSRGVLLVLTIAGNVIAGGSSFLLGSFLGQFPTALDAVGDVAVGAIAKARGVTIIPTMMPTNRIGATAEERELKKLRQNLEKLSGNDAEAEEMAGAELTVR